MENLKQLYDLVSSTFGYKAHMLYKDTERLEVGCILYDSFLLKCNINDRYGMFGAGIALGDSLVSCLVDFLGERCSLNSDPESVVSSLMLVDRYCRLRLPDKFLNAYDEAYQGTIAEGTGTVNVAPK